MKKKKRFTYLKLSKHSDFTECDVKNRPTHLWGDIILSLAFSRFRLNIQTQKLNHISLLAKLLTHSL
ncbi:hypothetical protein FXE79_18660 [Vibrio cholerae]|nr:hypothetical protein FXE79_18660 [Vibrio cholerae]